MHYGCHPPGQPRGRQPRGIGAVSPRQHTRAEDTYARLCADSTLREVRCGVLAPLADARHGQAAGSWQANWVHSTFHCMLLCSTHYEVVRIRVRSLSRVVRVVWV